jgi:hypothetical protein
MCGRTVNRTTAARLAAWRRWHGDEPPPDDLAELELDTYWRKIAEIVARAPRFTPEQIAILSRIFTYGSPPESDDAGDS